MSEPATKSPPTYLRAARLDAGYPNRETAATVIPYSPEAIGRHERGEVEISPEDIILYSRAYKRPDIPIRHCAGCPVGKQTGFSATDRDLVSVVLRFNHQYKLAHGLMDEFEDMAYDGVLDNDERPRYEAAMTRLEELFKAYFDMRLFGATQGVKKEPPSCQETTPSTNSSLSPCGKHVKP